MWSPQPIPLPYKHREIKLILQSEVLSWPSADDRWNCQVLWQNHFFARTQIPSSKRDVAYRYRWWWVRRTNWCLPRMEHGGLGIWHHDRFQSNTWHSIPIHIWNFWRSATASGIGRRYIRHVYRGDGQRRQPKTDRTAFVSGQLICELRGSSQRGRCIEALDAIDDRMLFALGQVRIDWQMEDFLSRLLCLRQTTIGVS